MKKLYVNPAAKTANMRIRTSLLAGSQVSIDSEEVSGNNGGPISADARTRVGATSLD